MTTRRHVGTIPGVPARRCVAVKVRNPPMVAETASPAWRPLSRTAALGGPDRNGRRSVFSLACRPTEFRSWPESTIGVLQSYVRFREPPHWRGTAVMGAERTGTFWPRADRRLRASKPREQTWTRGGRFGSSRPKAVEINSVIDPQLIVRQRQGQSSRSRSPIRLIETTGPQGANRARRCEGLRYAQSVRASGSL